MNGRPTLPQVIPKPPDSIYQYSAQLLNSGGVVMEFASLKYKIVLVVNIGFEDEKTLAREISHLERLAQKFSREGLVILVLPSHQFSTVQVSEKDMENRLHDMKSPTASSDTLVTFSPVHLNGADSHPLFRYLCRTIPMPADDPITFINDPDKITWRPVLRSDVAGDFEKFLLLPNGRPYKRYSRHFSVLNLGYDIKVMMTMLNHVRTEGPNGIKYHYES